MKPILTTLTILFLCQSLWSQTYWAKRQAGANVDETLGITSDSEGNSYSTGYFSSSADVSNEMLTVEGLTDIFVSKVSESGVTEWSVSFGGNQSDRGLGIAVDHSGKALICGFYTGFIDFGNGITLTSHGGQDAFLLKLDESGTPLWARGLGSAGNSDRANAVAVDSLGNVFITGQFSGDASFDGFDLNATDQTIDAFVVKYDIDGNAMWVKQGTAESLERGMSLATDNQGAVFVTGQFSGDLTFDILYENNVLNAFFIVKFSADGTEEWIRSAGGTQESIAYGMTSDGTNVYLTGDFGASISVLGGGFPTTITSGYTRAFFIMSFSSNGSLNWSSTAGSEALVSSRAIDYAGGEISVAGYFRCTFDQYSDEYGSATFNSIGFEDAFAARYSAQTGDFLWSRNFGSKTDEKALGVTILPDGLEVICGAFTDHLVLPSASDFSGLSLTTYSLEVASSCEDPNYGIFKLLTGNDGQDGFMVKVLSEERSPYDYFVRPEGGNCEPSVLSPCLYTDENFAFSCPDSAEICANNAVMFSPMIYSGELGYDYSTVWANPNGVASNTATTEGVFSVFTESVDGCYSRSSELFVAILPSVSPALLSDNVIVNNEALTTQTVEMCDGDTVMVWATYPDSLSGNWQESQSIIASGQDTVPITSDAYYDLVVQNAFGCTATNTIHVDFDPVAQDLPVEILFPFESDSISICENAISWGVPVTAVIEGTTSLYPFDAYDIDWTVNLGAGIGGSADSYISPIQAGWHVVTVSVAPDGNNPCNDIDFAYTDIDSVYIDIDEAPEPFVAVTGPSIICPGDTVVLYIDYSGTLGVTNLVTENFTDSVYVTSPGNYHFWVDSIGVNGCEGSYGTSHYVSNISSPQIFTDPPNSVICPNDSVQILSDTQGEFIWQGPLGSVSGTSSLWVQESGLYFAEVTLYEGCALVSNTIQLTEYSTPFLYSEDGFICEGATEEIWVVSNSMETIEWLPPLSGSDGSQEVTQAGIYSVEVTGCEITTDISIEILALEPEVTISPSNPNPVCQGDSILVIASGDFETYEWNPQGEGLSNWFGMEGQVSVTAYTDDGCQANSNTLNLSFEPTPPNPTFQYDLPCEGESIDVLISSNLQVNTLYGLGGAVFSNDSILNIDQLSGDTTLYVYLASAHCIGDTVSLLLSPKPYPSEPIIASNAPVCTGTNLLLEVLNSQPAESYVWLSPNGDVLQGEEVNYGIVDLSQEGDYLAYADLEDCLSDTTAIPVTLFLTRAVDLPPDTSLCFVEGFTLEADTIFASYLWSDNSSDPIFYVTAGTSSPIFLTATDFNGCESMDFTAVNFVDCQVNIPNIITPNGDGINDTWRIELAQPQFYQATVYNRSGRKVYESNDANQNWDGTNSISGEPCPEGAYFFVVQVSDFEGKIVEEQGSLSIMRK